MVRHFLHYYLKGKLSQFFWTQFFCLLYIRAPVRTGRNSFANCLVFMKLFNLGNIALLKCWTCCYWICKHIKALQFILADSSISISEMSSKFAIKISIVCPNSAKLKNMQHCFFSLFYMALVNKKRGRKSHDTFPLRH